MPMNAYLHPDDLPVDLQLDLLADGELPEAQRRELLERMDRAPAQWRGLAIRFLQQQTEKQSVRALMAGGRVVPVEVASPPPRRAVLGRVGWYRLSAVAAGLLIALGSALVTLMVVQHPPTTTPTMAARSAAEFPTNLPADMLGSPAAVSVSVPVVPAPDSPSIFPAVAHDSNRPSKTSYILQSDGKGGVMVIPVSMSKSPVY